jgi:hypothetical protein
MHIRIKGENRETTIILRLFPLLIAAREEGCKGEHEDYG